MKIDLKILEEKIKGLQNDYYFDESDEKVQEFEEDMENCYSTLGEAHEGGVNDGIQAVLSILKHFND